MCKSGRLAPTEADPFTEVPQFTGEPPSIAAERWFAGGQLSVAPGIMVVPAIPTMEIAGEAVIIVAEFTVAAPSSGAEPSSDVALLSAADIEEPMLGTIGAADAGADPGLSMGHRL